MAQFGTWSYGAAAVAFLMLAVLLATGWSGRGPGLRLVVACVVTAVWAGLLSLGALLGDPSAYSVALLECLRNGVWIAVLSGLATSAGVARGLSRVLTGTWLLAALYLLLAPFAMALGKSVLLPSVAVIGTGFALAVGGLMLLEQVYRNVRGEGRYAVKFLALALGTMWVYDLFLYSQAQLLRAIDIAAWDARGIVYTFAVPLIALAARRNPLWSLDIFVSRQVVFYTTTLLAVGAYLLLMALGGYTIRLYGGRWGASMQFVFLAGAGIVLFLLLASGTLRRRLRVFLAKNFYRNKYDYRVEWLRFIETLSTPEEGADTYETSVRAITQVFGSPGGVLYLRRGAEERYDAVSAWPRRRADLDRHPPVPITQDLPGFMARRQWVVDVQELVREPELYDNIVLPEPFGAAGPHRMLLPLLDGRALIGFVALEPPPPPFRPNYEDRDLLKTLGRHVATHLAQHEADRQLAENRQFEAYHRLTAFVMHDLKNLAAQLALIVANAERHKRNPDFVDDAIETIANSTARMQRLIEQLQRREVQGTKLRVALADVARRASERCSGRLPVPQLLPDPMDVAIECDPERFTMVVEHLIRNAQDATPEDGRITLEVSIGAPVARAPEPVVGEGGADASAGTNALLRVPHAVLTVTDTGSGMAPEFVKERLFKPFDTTKGSKGMGIGAYQAREYIHSIGGRIEVASAPGDGTRMRVLLPLSAS